MEKREQYKRLIMFLASAAIVATLTAIFADMWYTNFADNEEAIIKVFWRRGNYVLVGLYALMLYLFFKLYGGVTGDADEAAAALIEGRLVYNANVRCDHHEHHGEGHSCGSHGCGSHSCG